jgi:hypothetical protein
MPLQPLQLFATRTRRLAEGCPHSAHSIKLPWSEHGPAPAAAQVERRVISRYHKALHKSVDLWAKFVDLGGGISGSLDL